MELEQNLQSRPVTDAKPVLFSLANEQDQKELSRLLTDRPNLQIIDTYQDQARELFAMKNVSKVYTPEFKALADQHLEELRQESPLWRQGIWVYYPWKATLVHLLDHDGYQIVRTSRNRNFITAEEQQAFYDATVVIAGLSVGNSVALAMTLEGGPRRLRLADFDELALSNCNRIRTGIDSLGLNKAVMGARQIYEINPYAEIDLYTQGISEQNIGEMLDTEPRARVLIDELDNIEMKFLMREETKKRRLPLLMATDNGDDGMVDVERYDEDEDLPYFLGRLEGVSRSDVKGLSKFEVGQIATRLIGPENIASRMLGSVKDIGSSIISWPQLGGAALLNGCAVSYCLRRILNGYPLPTGRYQISRETVFLSQEERDQEMRNRQTIIAQMKNG